MSWLKVSYDGLLVSVSGNCSPEIICIFTVSGGAGDGSRDPGSPFRVPTAQMEKTQERRG